MKLHIQGKGSVTLSQQEFKARGGEGSVYVKGDTAFKVYDDPKRMIPTGKIQELSVLTLPDIIRPQDVLVDDAGTPLGYTMRFIPDAYPLCRLFPKAFRVREHFTPEKTVKLVQVFHDGVQHIHDRGILIVDLNELNFLVDKSFAHLYFIDTDSYQTPGFPATAIMDCIKDRHAPSGKFSSGTDWFSFAILSFMMFVGIHPYKGKHPKLADFDSRMKNNISVMNPDVSVPAVCLPFDVIPPAYRCWYEQVLEKGERCEPPAKMDGVVMLVVPSAALVVSGKKIEIKELLAGHGNIVFYEDGITVTDTEVTNGRMSVDMQGADVHVARLPVSGAHALVWLEGHSVRVRGFEPARDFVAGEMLADSMTALAGRVYVTQGTSLHELRFTQMEQRVVVSLHQVGNVSENSAYVFDGVIINDLLGAYYATILAESSRCYTVHLRELDGFKLIDAKFAGNVLMAIANKDGVYDRFIIRFDADYKGYDVQVIHDTQYAGLNFTVLDSGVCVSINEKDELELFSNRLGSMEVKVIQDPAVDAGMRLFNNDSQLIGARGDKLFRLSMR